MPRLSLWNSGRKNNDDRFFDRTISEFFGVGGTAVYVHAYLGPYDQTVTTTPAPSNVTSIQDVLFLENRDRNYSNIVYEMRGIYNVGDVDFDMRQFGLFLQGDTLFIEFHLNDMIALLGRKIMPGDVLELPHKRDEFPLDGGLATNKFYVVDDSSRASDGYAANWWPYIWRVKVSPMTDSQEFADITSQQALNPLGLPMTNADGSPATIGGLMSTLAVEMGIDEAVCAAAQANVTKRYFETRQYYIVPAESGMYGKENPWIFTGDGIPPNGAELVGSGTSFPSTPAQGDYYLRTDYDPPTLFQRSGSIWQMQEVDWRGTDWSVMHRFMKEFVNNSNTSTFADATTAPEKVNLSQTIKPRADF